MEGFVPGPIPSASEGAPPSVRLQTWKPNTAHVSYHRFKVTDNSEFPETLMSEKWQFHETLVHCAKPHWLSATGKPWNICIGPSIEWNLPFALMEWIYKTSLSNIVVWVQVRHIWKERKHLTVSFISCLVLFHLFFQRETAMCVVSSALLINHVSWLSCNTGTNTYACCFSCNATITFHTSKDFRSCTGYSLHLTNQKLTAAAAKVQQWIWKISSRIQRLALINARCNNGAGCFTWQHC